MGAVDRDDIKRILAIDEEEAVLFVIAFGYPTHTSVIEPLPQDGKTAYRLDDKGNYHVPKRAVEEAVRFV